MKGLLDGVPGRQSLAREAQGRVAAGLIPAWGFATRVQREGRRARRFVMMVRTMESGTRGLLGKVEGSWVGELREQGERPGAEEES